MPQKMSFLERLRSERYKFEQSRLEAIQAERAAQAAQAEPNLSISDQVTLSLGGSVRGERVTPYTSSNGPIVTSRYRVIRPDAEKYKPNGEEVEIIGVHSTADGVATTVNSRFVTDSGTGAGLTLQNLDSDSWSEGIEFLYRNSTGAGRKIYSHTLRGKLVTRHSGAEGYINDESLNFEDIAENGEQILQIGNNFIFNPTQVDELAEFHARSNFDYRHMYSCTFVGTHDWIEPGTWYTLNVGDGTEEDINSVVEVLSVTIERGTQGIGSTTVVFKEVLENWKPEWPTGTKFFSSGPAQRTFSRGNTLRISSAEDNETADYYCDGTADDVQIQAAIDRLAASGGGTVFLSPGEFFTAATTIDLKSGVALEGSGHNTYINGPTIGSYINVSSADNTSVRSLRLGCQIFISGSDNVYISNVEFTNTTPSQAPSIGVFSSSSNVDISNVYLPIDQADSNAIYLSGSSSINVSNVLFTGTATGRDKKCIYATSCTGVNISNVSIVDITSDRDITGIHIVSDGGTLNNITIDNLVCSNGSYNAYGIHIDDVDNCVVSGAAIRDVDNTATAANSIGVYVEGDNNSFSSFRIYNCSGTGLKTETTADQTRIVSGRTSGNGTDYTDNGSNTSLSSFATS